MTEDSTEYADFYTRIHLYMEPLDDQADYLDSVPMIMERALFRSSCQRDGHESMTHYISRKAELFRDLERVKCPLADSAKGYVLLRDAGLSDQMRDVIVTWLGGHYGYEEVQDALRDYERWTLSTESFSGHSAGDIGSASSQTAGAPSGSTTSRQPVATVEEDDEMHPVVT